MESPPTSKLDDVAIWFWAMRRVAMSVPAVPGLSAVRAKSRMIMVKFL
jgi:hypothetical protein